MTYLCSTSLKKAFLLRPLFYFLLASILYSGSASAQLLEWTHYTSNTGLTESFVYDIAQDTKGYLWIGTSKGLFRYNGREFVSFGQAEGLEQDFVTTVYPDSNGTIWTGHFRGGISRGTKGAFSLIAQESSWGPIKDFVSSNAGLFALSQKGGVLKLSEHAATVVLAPSKQGEQFYAMLDVGQGRFLIGSNLGLQLGTFVEGVWKLLDVDLPQLNDAVLDMAMLGSGQVVVGTQRSGVVLLSEKDKSWSVLPYPGVQEATVAVCVGKDQSIWAGHFRGASYINLNTRSQPTSSLKIGKAEGLSQSKVQALFCDAEGRVWVGTNGEGLWSIRPDAMSYFAGDEGQEFGGEKCLVKRADGTILTGGVQGVSQILFQKDAHIPGGVFGMETELLWSTPKAVSALCYDAKGACWIGTVNDGLWKSETGAAPKPVRFSDQSILGEIQHISKDQEGKIWVATSLQGVLIFDPESDVEPQHLHTANGLLHNLIFQVFHDQLGQHWFVTQGSGLAMMNEQGFHYFDKNQGLESLDFSCIGESPDGQLVVGMVGAGIYSSHNGAFVKTAYSPLLHGDVCRGIGFDGLGRLFLFTDRSILVASEADGALLRKYSFEDFPGFRLSSVNGYLLNDDAILVVGEAGVLQLPLPEPPKMVDIQSSITEIILSGQRHNLNKPIDLPYGNYRIRFNYGAINFNPDFAIQHQYKLEGFDEDWSPPTTDQSVDYTGLGDGEYTFLIRSAPYGRAFSAPPDQYQIQIRTPFWKTWWFLSAVLLVLSLGVWGFIRLRTYQLRKANLLLEEKVAERTERIRNQNKEIRQFTYSVSHDLKAPVNSLLGFSKMLNKIIGQEEKQVKDITGMMETTAQHLRSNLDRLMEVIRSRESAGRKKEWVNVDELWSDLQTNIHDLIQTNGAKFEFSNRVEAIFFNQESLFSIFYNLVTNAIKYSDPERMPVVKVEIEKQGEWMVVTVADNGLGIDLERHGDKLFGMFSRIHTGAEGSGVGLHLVKEMIESQEGRIEVESEPGKGTQFQVFLPANAPA